MNIAESIKKTRKELNLTQSQLASFIDSNRFNIANYETGRTIPPADVYLKIQDLAKKKPKAA